MEYNNFRFFFDFIIVRLEKGAKMKRLASNNDYSFFSFMLNVENEASKIVGERRWKIKQI